ncbi:MAG: NAD(P)-dependent oxidoreductase [Steroidobacteraceae bacterium]
MRIALVGATGNIGSRIVAELQWRGGHQITAISRHPKAAADTPALRSVAADLSAPEQLADVLRSHQAVISSIPYAPGYSERIVSVVRASGVKRFIAVGGAGSLEIAPGKLLKDSGQIPAEWMPAVNEATALLELLRRDPGLDWTFFSPAALIGPGQRTGHFRLGTDQLIVAADGKSSISYEDYASALVDELEKPQHLRQRFTIGY